MAGRDMGLTAKQRKFTEEYLICWNASEAARRAGYRWPYKVASMLMARPSIKALIAQRVAETAMSADEVLHRLAEHARGSMADFVDDRGNIDLERARTAGKLHLVKSYSEPGLRTGARIELYDAQAALEKLGKHLGVLRERHELTGLDGGPIEVHDIDAAIERELAHLAAAGETAHVAAAEGESAIP